MIVCDRCWAPCDVQKMVYETHGLYGSGVVTVHKDLCAKCAYELTEIVKRFVVDHPTRPPRLSPAPQKPQT